MRLAVDEDAPAVFRRDPQSRLARSILVHGQVRAQRPETAVARLEFVQIRPVLLFVKTNQLPAVFSGLGAFAELQ